jgi:hypothetical protein
MLLVGQRSLPVCRVVVLSVADTMHMLCNTTADTHKKQELTRSSKHPLGGQASLSVDDQEVM